MKSSIGSYGIHFSAKFVNFDIFTVAAIKEAAVLAIIFLLIPFFIQIIYVEKNSIFLSSAFITSFIGILLLLTNLEENRKLNLQQAFLLTTLSWLSVAIFGSLPFLLSGLVFLPFCCTSSY